MDNKFNKKDLGKIVLLKLVPSYRKTSKGELDYAKIAKFLGADYSVRLCKIIGIEEDYVVVNSELPVSLGSLAQTRDRTREKIPYEKIIDYEFK